MSKNRCAKHFACDGRGMDKGNINHVCRSSESCFVAQGKNLVLENEEDKKLFFDALENPPAPNENLKKAAKRYAELLLKPCDCKDLHTAKKLQTQGISHNDYSITVEPNIVLINLPQTTVKIPMQIFEMFAKWYLEEQEIENQ